VSRFLVLIPLLLWLIQVEQTRSAPVVPDWAQLAIFAGGLLLIVLLVAVGARRAIRDRDGWSLHRRITRFHHALFVARLTLLAWFGFGLFSLGWGDAVRLALRAIERLPVELPGVVLATAPAYLAWFALAWAQYPVERAWREQNLVLSMEDGRPLHPPPTLRQYLSQFLRLQVLFALAPVAGVLLLRDLIQLALWGRVSLESAANQLAISGAAIAFVFLLAPELLRRILPTTSLPPGPLRDRLQAFCDRTRLRHRDILLWHTHGTMSNAAVMGVIPRFRYVLLSDLLIETLSPRQVEAVFAHEVGHVRHHHMLWYLLFVVSGVLLVEGAADLLGAGLDPDGAAARALDWALSVGGLLLIVLMFGLLSRRCERQSDLFAARALIREPGEPALASYGATDERENERDPALVDDDPRHLPVKPHGAEVFAETLRRVAEVNGIPLHPRPRSGRRVADAFARLFEFTAHFLHGSIAERMQFVRQVAADPAATHRYDVAMHRLFGSVAVLLLLSLLLLFA